MNFNSSSHTSSSFVSCPRFQLKMSFRDESDDQNLRKPFLHTGSWYRMGSRQSSMMGSSQVIRDSSISVLACVLIVALGPIQFGFTVSKLTLSLSLSLPNCSTICNLVFSLICICFGFHCSAVIHLQRRLQSPGILNSHFQRSEF